MTKSPRENSCQSAPFNDLLASAHGFADLSGTEILPFFRTPISVDNKAGKGGFDPVTAADKAAEQAIVAAIAKRWPDHGVIGEEFGAQNPQASAQWVIDPIDGTRAFIMGYPTWGTLIGLIIDGEPILGIMDQPFTKERFWSREDASFWSDADGKQHKLQTRRCSALNDALITTTHPEFFQPGPEWEGFRALQASARMTRYGGDCYQYCMLAAGLVDVVVEAGLNIYDIAALVPIIDQAGGRVTTWDGGPAASGGCIVASGDPRLHDAVLQILSSV